ncbi:acyl carrier protein [Nonomuraea sp. NPDC004354]
MNTSAFAEAIRADLAEVIRRQTRAEVSADLDLFESGLVSSLFALELVVHVESTFGVTVEGPDLTLGNFRTIDAIAALVLRLSGGGDG